MKLKSHLWQKAAAFASRAHEGQYRKDGVTPYISHPFRVTLTLSQVFHIQNEKILAAALLHDTLEDTTLDYDDLAREFGNDVADWVTRLSKDKRLPEGRREDVYYEILRQSPSEVKLIKLADLYDNLFDAVNARSPKAKKIRKRLIEFLDELKKDKNKDLKRVISLIKTVLKRIKIS